MSMPAVSVTKYGLVNKVLPDVTTAARACNSWIWSWLKAITGTVVSGFTAGTGGAPPASSNWTWERSSNGTTAGAGDNFSNTYVDGEWLSAAGAVAHSWAVVKSPVTNGILDGPWYIFISKNSGTATTYTVSLSKTAWTGGSITADPSNAGTVSTTGATGLFNVSSTTAGKTHLYMDAKGNFFILCSRDGTGVCETGFLFTELEQTQPSGDSNRVFGYITHSTSGIFANINNGTNLSGANMLGFQRDGTAQTSSQMVLTAHNISGFTELNGINSDVEGIKYGMILCTKTANMCIKGFIPDIFQVTSAPTNGANHPDTTNPLWSALGSSSTSGKVLIAMPAVMSL